MTLCSTLPYDAGIMCARIIFQISTKIELIYQQWLPKESLALLTLQQPSAISHITGLNIPGMFRFDIT